METTQITAIDPVCGMAVNPVKARKHRHEGKSYFFCSDGCVRKFDADPVGVLAAREKKTHDAGEVAMNESSRSSSGGNPKQAKGTSDSRLMPA